MANSSVSAADSAIATAAPPPSALTPTGGIDLSAAITAAAALGKDGVEVLERLHVIAKEERAFAARQAFAQAMADLKAELPPIVKSVPGQHGATRVGTRTKGMYAPLDTITDVLDPIAARHGFSYRFDRDFQNGKEWSLCIVTHRGGHSETTRYPAMDDEASKGKSPLHARGSGDTYARRYALTGAFSIVTADPDDDGGAASESSPDPVSEAQAASLSSVLDEAKDVATERTRFLKWAGVAKVSDIPASRFADAMRILTGRRQKGWPA